MISPYAWWCGPAAASLLVGVLAFMLVPGAAIWLRLARRVDAPPPLSLLLALACSGILGYATFWVYLAHPAAGRVTSWTILAATVVLLALPAERRRLAAWLRDPEVCTPLLLLGGSACFALTWYLGFVPAPPPKAWNWVSHGYARLWIPDSSLPLLVAHKLARGMPLHEGLFAAETIARTPLQAGIVLTQYPAWTVLARVLPDGMTTLYETLGVVVQSSWIAAAWGLARLLGLGRARAAWLLLALVPSHFFVLNAAYVWPKLLSASFVVGAYCLLLLRPPDAPPLPPARAAAAAALASLGVLAHPAVAPTLIAVGLVLLIPRFFPGWRSAAVATLVVGALAGPWVAFQQTRPIDYSLAKRFVAGTSSEQPGSVARLMRDAWLARSPAAIAREKWHALRTMAGLEEPASRNVWRRIRLAVRGAIAPSLGILNLGWLAALAGVGGRRRDEQARVRRTLGVALLSLALALLVLFESGPLRHTSYATVTMLFVALGVTLTALPGWLAATVLGAHVVTQLVVFSTQLEAAPFTPAPPTLAFALAIYAALSFGVLAASRKGRLGTAAG